MLKDLKEKYKFYNFHVDTEGKKVIAVTHYAGKTIKGIAKCSPEDTFDVEYGCALAVARAERKVAKAKVRNAVARYIEAAKAADEAQRRYDAMKQYYMDAVDQFDDAEATLEEFI